MTLQRCPWCLGDTKNQHYHDNEWGNPNINENSSIALKNKEGFLLATMEVSDIWKPNLKKEAMAIYGSSDEFHPGVNYLFNIGYEYYLGGLIKKISPPIHYDYKKYLQ